GHLSNVARGVRHLAATGYLHIGGRRPFRRVEDQPNQPPAPVLGSRPLHRGTPRGVVTMAGIAGEDGPYRIIGEAGQAFVEPADLGLKDEDLRELLRLLIGTRVADLEG